MISCNAEGFAGETGAVNVLEGGERETPTIFSADLTMCWRAIPHSDAASQNALDGASVEGAHDGGWGSGSSEFAEEVEALMCFLGQYCSDVSPAEVLLRSFSLVNPGEVHIYVWSTQIQNLNLLKM